MTHHVLRRSGMALGELDLNVESKLLSRFSSRLDKRATIAGAPVERPLIEVILARKVLRRAIREFRKRRADALYAQQEGGPRPAKNDDSTTVTDTATTAARATWPIPWYGVAFSCAGNGSAAAVENDLGDSDSSNTVDATANVFDERAASKRGQAGQRGGRKAGLVYDDDLCGACGFADTATAEDNDEEVLVRIHFGDEGAANRVFT